MSSAPAQPSSIDAEPLLWVQRLSKRYGSSTVVDGVSFGIARGEILGLVGESGSGKSTVARMVLRLIEPSAGRIHFDGVDLLRTSPAEMQALRRRMSIVFQDPFAALNPRMTVEEIVAEPIRIHGAYGWAQEELPPGRIPRRLLSHQLAALLEEVGMPRSALERYPHEFSGGQRQRINIARALALRPEFLVLDEPVSALDVSVGAQIINLLRELRQRHSLTALFISHSMPLVRYLCDRIAVMQHGRLVETGAAVELCAHPREPYTASLIAATPELPV